MRTPANHALVLSLLLAFGASIDRAIASSPVDGTWYNSYCSRMDLTVDDQGMISGVYTSHTGSTGSSRVVGYVDPDAASHQKASEATKGIPFSAGIQWRLINVPSSKADGSWHWVSTFAGQYHPTQTISGAGQKDYDINDTLEILNGLIVTANLPGFADSAPTLWPQTLDFHRKAPDYCTSVSPPSPAEYTPTAADRISGTWIHLTPHGEERLDLDASISTGRVSGTYESSSEDTYTVSGLFDTLAGDADVVQQGLTLAAYQPVLKKLKVMAGGVSYSLNSLEMTLWRSDLQSTTWTDRFTQSTLDKSVWIKQIDNSAPERSRDP